jgi:hypothetical protein
MPDQSCQTIGDPASSASIERHALEDLETLFELGARELLAHAFMYTACAPPTGTDESKIAIATSGCRQVPPVLGIGR